MKVQILMTVDVDIDKWSDEYGVERSRAIVRDDVRSYVATQVAQSYPAEAGLFKVVKS